MQVESSSHIEIVESSATAEGSTTVSVFQFAPGNTWSRVAKLMGTASSYDVLSSAGVGMVRGDAIQDDC